VPQSRYGRDEKKKIPASESNLGRPIRCLINEMTELSQLLFMVDKKRDVMIK